MTTPTRPALRYYGGKWNLAKWIISHMPPHTSYLEPCCGASSVLFQKPRVTVETINDTDGNVVNFFEVLRNHPDELIRRLRYTPWSRQEHRICMNYSIHANDKVEAARRFCAYHWMSISASSRNSGWRCITKSEQRRAISAFDLQRVDFEAIANRLLGVQIECKSCFDLIPKFDDHDTLIYFDPPYVHSTRTSKTEYSTEWSDEMHGETAALLRQSKSMVVVSGYSCDLYTELYEIHGWQRVDKVAQVSGGGKRVESLWLSPSVSEMLEMPQQRRLFR